MTVTVQSPAIQYAGDGIQDTFSFAFRLLENSDLRVFIDTVEQVEISDYTIENLTEAGGDVVFITPPADLTVVNILRATSKDQQTDYAPFDAFPADTHELGLDKLTMIVQEIEQRVIDDVQPVVFSVFGRIGDVVADVTDYNSFFYTQAQIDAIVAGLQGDIDSRVATSGDIMTGDLVIAVAPDDIAGAVVKPTSEPVAGQFIGYTIARADNTIELGLGGTVLASGESVGGLLFADPAGAPFIGTTFPGQILVQNLVLTGNPANLTPIFMPIAPPEQDGSALYFNTDGSYGYFQLTTVTEETDTDNTDTVLDGIFQGIGLSITIVFTGFNAATVTAQMTVVSGANQTNSVQIRLIVNGVPDPDVQDSIIGSGASSRFSYSWENISISTTQILTVEVLRTIATGAANPITVSGTTNPSTLSIRQLAPI